MNITLFTFSFILFTAVSYKYVSIAYRRYPGYVEKNYHPFTGQVCSRCSFCSPGSVISKKIDQLASPAAAGIAYSSTVIDAKHTEGFYYDIDVAVFLSNTILLMNSRTFSGIFFNFSSVHVACLNLERWPPQKTFF